MNGVATPDRNLLAHFLSRTLDTFLHRKHGPQPIEDEPLRLDLRGLWSLIGAWAAALLGVRIPQEFQQLGAVACLGFASLGVLLLLRPRHARFGGETAPLFAAPTLLCAAAGLVLAQMVLTGATAVPEPLRVAAEKSMTVRVRVEFDATARASSTVNKFSEGAGPQTSYRAAAHTELIRQGETWQRAEAAATLIYGQAMVPGKDTPTRGTRAEILARVSATPPGQRSRFILVAVSPLQFFAPAENPGPAALMRQRFQQQARVLPEPGRALLPGMVFGERGGQSEELSEAMKASGLSHLSAVSGANCAMVLGVSFAMLRFAGTPRLLTMLLGLGALAGFVVLVGDEPSVMRAGVMGAIGAFSVHSSRGRNALSALCLAVVILLAVDPYLAGEAGFQLSALATAGIVLLGRRLADRFKRRMPGFLAEGTAIAVAAQIACLPVLVGLSPTFSLYSVPANLLVAPLIPWITITGTLGLVVQMLWAPLGAALIWVAGIPATLVGLVGLWVADLPGALRPWPVGLLGICLAWGIFLGVFFSLGYAPQHHGTWHSLIPAGVQSAAVGLILGITLPVTALVPAPSVSWLVVACDVGQGDGLVLNAGDAGAVVLDTGRDPADVDACLGRLRVRKIATIFITHQHADHDGGIAGAGRNRQVQQVFYSILDNPHKPPKVNGIRGHQLAAGATGSAGNVAWRVLAPKSTDSKFDENDASLVIRFEIKIPETGKTVSMLATGDMQETGMGPLLASGAVTPADILKVSHHGAANGGTGIIGIVRPSVALISVGKDNTYGHPNPGIVKALQNHGVLALRTDERGTVVLGWNNGSLAVSTLETSSDVP